MAAAGGEFAEFGGAFRQFQFFNFGNLRQRHRAADGMAEKGAGVNRLAASRPATRRPSDPRGRRRRTAGNRR